MKIKSIEIHNFRSIKDAKFNLHDYNILVGANNSGKTNILTTLRIFYEDKIKFEEERDFPKFPTDDNESWIEIEYQLTDDEFENLKEEYKNPNNILKVRKYLKDGDNTNRVKTSQSNIYAYENGKLSTNLFYGAKNISQAKLGTMIHIPEVQKLDDTLKLTGPSPLRDTLNFVMKKVIESSKSFQSLNEAFEMFNQEFKEESSKDGFSLNKLKSNINEELKEWGVEFDININPVQVGNIIKNLISHNFKDKKLNQELDINLYGQGLQRHLIYILIRLSAEYREKKEIHKKKEFSPELTLILFEEPEAFLHPTQQEILNDSLKILSSEERQQIIISTHSPLFVSKNIEDISSLIKLKKDNTITNVFQVSENLRNNLIEQNNELAQMLKDKLNNPSVNESTKRRIRRILGNTPNEKRIEEEAIRYLLWLDSERCAAFYADKVLICEGATEKIFINYLIKNKWKKLRQKRLYVLDAMGKFNIHRYMNLFQAMGIYHSVLADKDKNADVHRFINKFIEDNKNEYTIAIDFFDKKIEDYLGISTPPENRRDKKPLNVIWHYKNNGISKEKIDDFRIKIEKLLGENF